MSLEPEEMTEAELEAKRKREAELTMAQEEEDAELREVMATPRGRRWVWRHLTRCGIYRLSYTPSDVTATSFNEGGRNIGLGLLADIMRICPEQYAAMVAEQQKAGGS